MRTKRQLTKPLHRLKDEGYLRRLASDILRRTTVALAYPRSNTSISIRSLLRNMGVPTILSVECMTQMHEISRHRVIDIAILKGELPDGDAISFLKSIRVNSSHLAYLPVFVVLEAPSQARVIEFINAGANEVIAEPFTTLSFQQKVRRCVVNGRAFVESERYWGPDRRKDVVPIELERRGT